MTVVFFFFRKYRFLKRLSGMNAELGIPRDYARLRQLPVQMEARDLVSVGLDIYQREQRLLRGADVAWLAMQEAASADGIELQLVSAYRSVDYQQGIVQRKLEKGQDIETILRVSAAPGYSEHHSGRAIDLTTPGFNVLEEEFEDSEAFRWLRENAGNYGFHMSFPRDNPHGVAYEPWHWAWNNQA
jgi:D-alanyl-D-alanine carboxypeptidase